ncbi:MAG: hypothetical protein ACYCWW_07975 [Deltaproteobacteria bacterium]
MTNKPKTKESAWELQPDDDDWEFLFVRNFEMIDPSGPYFARRRFEYSDDHVVDLRLSPVPEIPSKDRGHWPDLKISSTSSFDPGDGDLRAHLLTLGVTKAAWLALPVGRRKAIVSFWKRRDLIEVATVWACIECSSPNQKHLSDLGRQLLERVSDVVRRSAADKGGFGFQLTRLGIDDDARGALPRLEERLGQIKREALHARNRYSQPEWKEGHVRRINRMFWALRRSGTPIDCGVSDLESLKTMSPKMVAIQILKRAYPKLAKDSLRRKRVRFRVSPQ